MPDMLARVGVAGAAAGGRWPPSAARKTCRSSDRLALPSLARVHPVAQRPLTPSRSSSDRPSRSSSSDDSSGHSADEVALFGAGGDDPYGRALRRGGADLRLVGAATERVRTARFLRRADATDLGVLDRARGALLDVGCGPARMVAAAIERGLPALGVDTSAAAVRLARDAGLPVLHRSVFDPLGGRRFATVLLLDGNVGIGGAPAALLARCGRLLATGGNLLVEVDRDPRLHRSFLAVLTDDRGGSSAAFPWAELGLDAVIAEAAGSGLEPAASWDEEGRTFVELQRRTLHG